MFEDSSGAVVGQASSLPSGHLAPVAGSRGPEAHRAGDSARLTFLFRTLEDVGSVISCG